MIDSNYLSLNIPGDLDLVSSNLIYTSPLDSSPPPSSNHLGFYDHYGDYENQNNLNNLNVVDFNYTDITSCTVNANTNNNAVTTIDQHYYNDDIYPDDYNLTNLTNQLVENAPMQSISSTYDQTAIVTSSTSEINHRYSSISPTSLSSSDYVSSNQRSLSTTRIDSIDDCKRNLIKATLNFSIKKRRKARGLGEVEFKAVKAQEPKPSIWTEEDDEKKMSRRERNRIAARKCRKNRKLKFIKLNKTMENLGNVNNNLREQLRNLERESGQLENLLTSHQPQCYLISWSSQPMLASVSSSISSPSLSSSPSPNHMLINNNNRNKNYSQSDESHGFISYINQSHVWPNTLQ